MTGASLLCAAVAGPFLPSSSSRSIGRAGEDDRHLAHPPERSLRCSLPAGAGRGTVSAPSSSPVKRPPFGLVNLPPDEPKGDHPLHNQQDTTRRELRTSGRTCTRARRRQQTSRKSEDDSDHGDLPHLVVLSTRRREQDGTGGGRWPGKAHLAVEWAELALAAGDGTAPGRGTAAVLPDADVDMPLIGVGLSDQPHRGADAVAGRGRVEQDRAADAADDPPVAG